MRFSIRGLLASVTAAAVLLVSLIYCNQWLGDAYYTLCVAVVFVAWTSAIATQGEQRAFWLGFAAAASLYGGLTIFGRYSDTSNFYRYLRDGEVGGFTAELITSRALTHSYEFIAAEGGGGHYFQQKREFERFMPYLTIGHSAFALLSGWAAGAWVKSLYRKRVPRTSS